MTSKPKRALGPGADGDLDDTSTEPVAPPVEEPKQSEAHDDKKEH